ncbi:Plus3 domain-containing protein [Abeliophyllum distichum]|uniref:Plus3 domain-containing protein n=1 Tax=Abeliophyllum distichum TaxID=126358 RepID=A0ABD1VY02_9LAMI
MAFEDFGFGDMSGVVVVIGSREVSLELVEVLSIREIDICTGKEIRIAGYDRMGLVGGGLVGSSFDFVGKWVAEDIPSIVSEAEFDAFRQSFRVPADIRFHVPEPHERACILREGCVALHVQSFNIGMRLLLDLFYRCVLRAYRLAPTQVAPNGWSQMAGSLYLWFRQSIGFEMPLYVFQTVYLLKKLPRKKDKEEEVGWYYFGPWGAHKPFVLDCPSSIKLWKEAWFWVFCNWQRVVSDAEQELDVPGVYGIANALLWCELKEEELDILREIYGQASEDRHFGKLICLPKYLIELDQMATKGMLLRH